MVLVQNKYKNTLVGVLRTQITFVTHSSPSCYVTLRTQVIRLNSGNLGPQKTDSGVFIIVSLPISPSDSASHCKRRLAGENGISATGWDYFSHNALLPLPLRVSARAPIVYKHCQCHCHGLNQALSWNFRRF